MGKLREVFPFGKRAALLADDPAAARAAAREGLALAAEVTEGGAARLEPRRAQLWLFVGPVEGAWLAAERAERGRKNFGGGCSWLPGKRWIR
ncbi:hypothetical protein [Desulfovirgula thermocuniculi]|uniref:hypothetical protein n=1 Tax=Desulfovirgula thermocuniculi TaxID=348842 RepID=UPI0003F85619|nr:hypothetical protein [Desulfovirgula thermocuniculi]